jgi:glutamate carboxypeptidase
MTGKTLIEHIQGLEAEIVGFLKEIIEIESPTTDREAVNRVGELVQRKVRALEGTIAIEPSGQADRGDHIVARWEGSDPSLEPILVIAHMDTVWNKETLKEMPFRVDGNKIYGPGVYDMKGAIVFILTAIDIMRKLGLQSKRPITCLFNSDEEINSTTSRGVIDREARKSKYALVLEGGIGDAVITSRKGILYFKMTAKGKSAHAGMDHEKGINAIEEIAHQILAIQQKTDYTRGTTLNCGIVQGGTRTNVIPGEAVLEVDSRVSTKDEEDRIVSEMKSLSPVLKGVELDIYSLIKRPPMDRSEGGVQLYNITKKLAEELGLDLPEASTGGISDGNLTAAIGVPTLDGLGPIGDGAHAVYEHIEKDKIPQRIALLVRLLQEL